MKKKIVMSSVLAAVIVLAIAVQTDFAATKAAVAFERNELQQKIDRELSAVLKYSKEMAVNRAESEAAKTKVDKQRYERAYELSREFRQDSLDLIERYEMQLIKLKN